MGPRAGSLLEKVGHRQPSQRVEVQRSKRRGGHPVDSFAAAGFGLSGRFLAGFCSGSRRRLRCRGLGWRCSMSASIAGGSTTRARVPAGADPSPRLRRMQCRGLSQPSLTRQSRCFNHFGFH